MQQMLDFWCFSFFLNFYFVFGLVWFSLFFLSLRANINEKETHQVCTKHEINISLTAWLTKVFTSG